MQLEIKHLAAYLPYRLKIQGQTHKVIETLIGLKGETVFIESSKSLYPWCDIWEIKPILRPLSDLTKEIEVNGEKFIPAGKMITHGFHNKFWYEINNFNYKYLYAMDLELLLSWHFDVFNLIDNGLAININTL